MWSTLVNSADFMGVLSKLVNAVAPKSVASVLLWMLPIAAAVIVVAYPHAITLLFVRDDPERLLEELTSGDIKKRKRAGGAKKSNGAAPRKAAVIEAAEDNAESSDNDTRGLSDEEQLLHLASLQGKTTSLSQGKKETKVVEAKSPIVAQITLNEALVSKDEDSWKRIPTREEEITSSLKSKVTALTKQLEETLSECKASKSQAEKENKRANEAEKELKDRSRNFQTRWLDLENEITSLKATRDNLTTRLSELGNMTVANEAHEQMMQSLNAKIVELENKTMVIPTLNEQLAALMVSESQAKSELSECQQSLTREVENLSSEKAATRDLEQQLAMASSRNAELASSLQEAQKSKAEVEGKLKSLENDLKETQSRLASIAVEKAAINGELSSVKKYLEEVQVSVANLSEMRLLVDSQQQENAELKDTVESLERTAEEKIEKIATLEGEKEEMKQELEKAKRSLAATSEIDNPKYDELTLQVQELQSQCQSLSERNCKAQEIVAEKIKALENAEKKMTIMNNVSAAKYASFDKEIAELKAEREELLRKIAA